MELMAAGAIAGDRQGVAGKKIGLEIVRFSLVKIRIDRSHKAIWPGDQWERLPLIVVGEKMSLDDAASE